MSTESHNPGQEPRHKDVSFEERDIKPGVVYGYLFALSISVVASLIVCVFILRLTTTYTVSTDVPPPPSREIHQRELPPDPRLRGFGFLGQEAIPRPDLRKKIRATP